MGSRAFKLMLITKANHKSRNVLLPLKFIGHHFSVKFELLTIALSAPLCCLLETIIPFKKLGFTFDFISSIFLIQSEPLCLIGF